MQQDYSYKKFTISNIRENLPAAFESISAYISEVVRISGDDNNIILRSKWVLTELLTNASKHTKDNLICFEIHSKNGVLEIVRSECGRPFPLSINSRINIFSAARAGNKRIVIQKDDLCTLYATVSKDGTLIFEVEDVEIIEGTVSEIIEHFGLIIITRSSDRFVYAYDKFTNTNVFRASFQL